MDPETEKLVAALAAVAGESHRLCGAVYSAMNRMPAEDAARLGSRVSWFSRRIALAISAAGLRTVDLTGQPYDPGMAVTAMNIDDFDENDALVIGQMLEPVLMRNDSVYQLGKVILERTEQ